MLVTNWAGRELLAVAQMYRDRAGAENLFDELKNQWGWTGFTTRALFQQAVAQKTRHANQTRLSISSLHDKAKQIANLLGRISQCLKLFIKPAEPLPGKSRWGEMLRKIFAGFGRFPLQSDPQKGIWRGATAGSRVKACDGFSNFAALGRLTFQG